MYTKARLEDYVSEVRSRDRSEFEQLHPHAFLLCRADRVDDGEKTDFVTRVAPENPRSGLDSLAIHPSLGVIELRKRAGGGFSERIGIGRARNSDIVLPYGRISKLHAFFVTDDQGRYLLTDAGSRNGTFVDGNRLEPRAPIEPAEGAIVRFAEETFRFHRSGGLYEVLRMLH
jgi:hypothetical protein